MKSFLFTFNCLLFSLYSFSQTVSGYDAVVTAGYNSTNYQLIGVYQGFDPNGLFIAGYHYYNRPDLSAVKRIYMGGLFQDLQTGYIGLGTLLPQARLQIVKNNVITDAALTNTMTDNLVVLQSPYQSVNPQSYNGAGYKWGIKLVGTNEPGFNTEQKTGAIYAVSEDQQTGYNKAVGLAFHTSATDNASAERLRISSNGNVGIGTTTPDQKLTVNGTIHATKVLVDASVPTPDYVFEKDYKLRSLKEVEAYIKANKHLPEVASAKEMLSKGVDVNQMNMKLLQKLEEMTLYMIELKKANEYQLKQIKKQRHSIKKLNYWMKYNSTNSKMTRL